MPQIQHENVQLFGGVGQLAARGTLRTAKHNGWTLYAGWLSLMPAGFFAVENNGPAALENFKFQDEQPFVVLHAHALDLQRMGVRVALGVCSDLTDRWSVLPIAKTMLET